LVGIALVLLRRLHPHRVHPRHYPAVSISRFAVTIAHPPSPFPPSTLSRSAPALSALLLRPKDTTRGGLAQEILRLVLTVASAAPPTPTSVSADSSSAKAAVALILLVIFGAAAGFFQRQSPLPASFPMKIKVISTSTCNCQMPLLFSAPMKFRAQKLKPLWLIRRASSTPLASSVFSLLSFVRH